MSNGIPEGEKKDKKKQEIFEALMTENFSKLMTHTKPTEFAFLPVLPNSPPPTFTFYYKITYNHNMNLFPQIGTAFFKSFKITAFFHILFYFSQVLFFIFLFFIFKYLLKLIYIGV